MTSRFLTEELMDMRQDSMGKVLSLLCGLFLPFLTLNMLELVNGESMLTGEQNCTFL